MAAALAAASGRALVLGAAGSRTQESSTGPGLTLSTELE
jgi:hypothetical protein